MTKRILYIIIGSALILILILGLWFWFFARGGSEAANPSGLFGTSGDATNAGAGIGDDQGNAQAPIGSNASQDAGGDISYVAPASNSGAVWLDGSGRGRRRRFRRRRGVGEAPGAGVAAEEAVLRAYSLRLRPSIRSIRSTPAELSTSRRRREARTAGIIW